MQTVNVRGRPTASHNMEEECSEEEIIYKQHISYISLVEVQEKVSSVSVRKEKSATESSKQLDCLSLICDRRTENNEFFTFHLVSKSCSKQVKIFICSPLKHCRQLKQVGTESGL